MPDEDLARLKLQKNADSTAKLDYFDDQTSRRHRQEGRAIHPLRDRTLGGRDARDTGVSLRSLQRRACRRTESRRTRAPARWLAAARKNIDKKIAEAEKAAERRMKADAPTAAQLRAINEELARCEAELPQSLLAVEDACDLPGRRRVELLKKVRQAAAKLCDEYTRVVLKLHPRLAPIKVAVFPLKKNEPRIVETAKRIKPTFNRRSASSMTIRPASANSTAARTRSAPRSASPWTSIARRSHGDRARPRLDASRARGHFTTEKLPYTKTTVVGSG